MIRVKGIYEEDFINYKEPAMVIITSFCSFKCGEGCCQNSSLAKTSIIAMPIDEVIKRYIGNPITKAIVFGGLEPFDQFEEIYSLISKLRLHYKYEDMVVIYTGYNRAEISSQVEDLKTFKNITIKFGRYVPNKEYKFDETLGVTLSSPNQYAEVIS